MKKLDITAQKSCSTHCKAPWKAVLIVPVCGFTSPTAPKSRCPNRRTKSKSHAAVLSPSHLKCGGLFLLILLNFTVNVESMLAAFLWVKKLLALYIAKLERFLQVIPLY